MLAFSGKIGLLAVLALLVGNVEQAKGEMTFQAFMNGANVRPDPLPTLGTGLATLTLNDLETELRFEVAFQDLISYTTRIDIHFGSPNEVGPELFLLSQGAKNSPVLGALTAGELIPQPSIGINTFEDAILAMINNNIYMEIHTPAFFNDPFFTTVEVRGQLSPIPVPEPSTLVLLCIGSFCLLGYAWGKQYRRQ